MSEKKKPLGGDKLQPRETKKGEQSCFPVDEAITRRFITPLIGADEAGKSAFISKVFSEKGFGSSVLALQTFQDLLEIRPEEGDTPEFQECALEYMLAVTVTYSIFKGQARVRGARFPLISQGVVDSYMQDVTETIKNDSLANLLGERDRLSEADAGFMDPLREYAPDPELSMPQWLFICGAIDTYNRIRIAETADKMIREVGLEETGVSHESELTKDALRHSLAFRGNSGELLRSVIADVRTLTADGGAVYPLVFPSWQEPDRAPTLNTEPTSSLEGQLTPAEAVAFRVLGDESSVLLQFFGRRFETSGKIDKILGTGENAWQSDAIEAIGELGGLLAVASGVRERMLSGQEEPQGRSLQDIVRLRWDRMFRQSLHRMV